ncbi:MAG TPA: hypothetical protein VKC60_12800 [Opitutaceae bacterium]|nr:hypothetical protein [Opitutaceae bacterium]
MPTSSEKRADSDPLKGVKSGKRDDWFEATPDPWEEIATIDYGADRTFASTVRSMVINAEPAQRSAMESKLLAALTKPNCTDYARSFICKMLALIGSTQCVPVLAPLLKDPKTTDIARYALEQIADPAVDAAFLAALGSLQGAPKAGLIGSIGLRSDTAAVSALTEIQRNPAEPAPVHDAAMHALERLNAKT